LPACLTQNIDAAVKASTSTAADSDTWLLEEEQHMDKTLPCVAVICGQDVAQEGGKLNTELRNQFLKESSVGDWAIFAGTPKEKTVFLEGLEVYQNFQCGKVSYGLYMLEGRHICVLENYQSQQSVHNCVEALWAFQGLETEDHIFAPSSVYGLMYDKSQCIRTTRFLGKNEGECTDYIKQYPHLFRQNPVIKPDGTRQAPPEEQYESNVENMGEDANKSISQIITERSVEHDIVPSSNAWNCTLEAFTNFDTCVHIGSAEKAKVEKYLYSHHGAGVNGAEKLAMTAKVFTMDGVRMNAASNA
tara:strand:- start:132 stop:1040 length:909 start_codon:yes stop_codon:yes gene_type:complete